MDFFPVADTGQAFFALAGQWGTHRYRAYLTPATDDWNGVLVTETGIANGTVSVKLYGLSGVGTQGLIVRARDVNNLFICRVSSNKLQVLRRQAGLLAFIGEYEGAFADVDELSVELSGPSITVKQNSIVRLSLTDDFNQTATRHGLWADNSAAEFDDFTVEPSIVNTGWIHVSSPQPYQVQQRDGNNKADLQIKGTYSGSPTAIEARYNHGDWQTLDAAPANGQFSGMMRAQAAGQGTLEVRFANDPSVKRRQRYIGIGDVFLIAGQSNAEGRITEPQFYYHPTLRAGVFDQAGSWREAYDPTDSSLPNQHSVWPLVATRLMASQNIPVAFITTAQGETGLLIVGGNGGMWRRSNYTYETCVSTVQHSNVNGLKAILWYQGELDAVYPGLPIYRADFERLMRELRDNLSTDLGLGPLKMVVAQIAYFHSDVTTETRESLDTVRYIQSKLWDVDANFLPGPVLYDLDISQAAGGDGQHIKTSVHAQIEAARWWHMLKYNFYGGAEGRGPRFSFATQPDETHLDVVFNLNAGVLLPLAPPTAGWHVSDANGLRAITGAARLDERTIRLTLDQPLSGNVEVSWASYNDAVGISLTDSTSDRMPAEPFTSSPVQRQTYGISGTIADSGGVKQRGILVRLSGSQEATTQTDADGVFTFARLPAGGTYTVIPAQDTYSLTPRNQIFVSLSGNETVNFTVAPNIAQFRAAAFAADEGAGSAVINVTRAGDISHAATVDYSTFDGTARQRSDYTSAAGTLNFAPGETSKTFTVELIDNAYVDGSRTVNLNLTSPNGLLIGEPHTALLTITDNDTAPSSINPIDDTRFFVRQHYLDFLDREPDTDGMNYWTDQIARCGDNAGCLYSRRVGVSAAYFIEAEFQQTGSFVYRLYKTAYGQRPTYAQFTPDRSRLIAGVDLASGKQALAELFVNRPEFLQKYPVALNGPQFVDALLKTVQQGSGVDISNRRSFFIQDYNINLSRARVLRLLAEEEALKAAEYNNAFVLMQYFGYLRRDPEEGGYLFWLNVLNNKTPGNYRGMVCAFLTSAEYQQRFGPTVTRNDKDCASITP
jgi:hypothetical protein